MFETVTDKFRALFSKLTGQKTISEDNVADALAEVRLALLEADVQYSVVKHFIKRVKERAIGEAVIKSVTPGQQFIKIVHDELVNLMGKDEATLELPRRPATIFLCGLQGSGKTTHTVKIAHFLQKRKGFRMPAVVACDLQRPAAKEQLKTLADRAGVACYIHPTAQDPVEVAQEALKEQACQGWDLVLFDTAGRLHIDATLMEELACLKKLVNPDEVLLVANGATGQDAVKTATAFNEQLGISGIVLTMLDGTSRGGAAISMVEVTGRAVKFEGIGEKLEDLQIFNPVSMADRILGMGDTINLVRKAEEVIQEDDAKEMERKLRTASFTFEDFLKQSRMMKKMGSLKSLFGMIPGLGSLKDVDINDNRLFALEAIVLSMTFEERQGKCEMNMSRRKRIARGSGVHIDEVNKFIKSFKDMKNFLKNMPSMKKLEQVMGGGLWR